MTATLVRGPGWYQTVLLGSLLAAAGCQNQPSGTGSPTAPVEVYRTPPGAPAAASDAPNERPDPFRYELSKVAQVDVIVLDRQRQPIPGAAIGIYSPSSAPALGRTLLWQGYTQANGRAQGKFMRRIDLNELELVIHKPGYIGAYHDEPLRTQVGVFAPASRVLLRAGQLSSYTSTLWKK